MRIIGLLRNKLKSKRGETLTETLSSLLIIVPAMVMLAGAIVAAARINYEARTSEASKYPTYVSPVETSGDTIDITGTISLSGNITWCREDKSVYYYFR
ncbi:hypothetical protein [Butyrivibrio sp. FCS014]|uniref:hypothetical protein n=1 Tax=Butyrivibrio sp. FCS014 TaxID=1408304 RepID=UPI0004672A16|nr:hypothetical protein [Butyrivibrio sp. FCS014]